MAGDLDDQILLPAPRSHAERARARRTTAAYARDTDDLRLLLDVLGLWPHTDPRRPPSPLPSPFTGGYRQRHPELPT
ncbi:MAG: hypothetical protein ACRDTZ_00190 [Pseudonocardiaceae bacterium]